MFLRNCISLSDIGHFSCPRFGRTRLSLNDSNFFTKSALSVPGITFPNVSILIGQLNPTASLNQSSLSNEFIVSITPLAVLSCVLVGGSCPSLNFPQSESVSHAPASAALVSFVSPVIPCISANCSSVYTHRSLALVPAVLLKLIPLLETILALTSSLYSHGLSFLIFAICRASSCVFDKLDTLALTSTHAAHATCFAYAGHSDVPTHEDSIFQTVELPYV